MVAVAVAAAAAAAPAVAAAVAAAAAAAGGGAVVVVVGGSSSSSHGVHTKLGPTWRCQSAQSREVFGMGVAASEGAWMGIASGKRCGGPVYF